jgi:ABC-type polysaccharide/polyol phosphate transport system ATPase subunit
MSSPAAAVSADRVSKIYRIYDSSGDRLRELIFRRPRHREFHALRDVSLELPRGRALGVIGENGAGKSTLLKIIAGTTRASSGRVECRGAVASILELGMGFHPDFTGRENARMNAAILGLSGPQIRQRLPRIRDFAELSEFFDQPVRTYSSGMVLRLAFAVATHADAEILIVDEALAVGDGYFQKKSIDRITEFHRKGGTLLFCSHALYYVAMVCDEALWLRNGTVAGLGPALPIVRRYEAFLQERERTLLADGEMSRSPAGEDPARSPVRPRRRPPRRRPPRRTARSRRTSPRSSCTTARGIRAPSSPPARPWRSTSRSRRGTRGSHSTCASASTARTASRPSRWTRGPSRGRP